ncbi:helix-turn-helix domain-containing protein [Halanaeroarchaeum sulfurireducens]|uniref:Bacterio-opsin activator HTH domain-containing protein n=1 Tax=Halanaeroarchaeum sulfurireducens TaxID=1604004 RepID=A0A0F7PD46_9EURY|nr:helix-turn-helix domain-containing protein [Halanaeroarchaeum sulfurireducens]AKH97569.1 bacterio-opsin activator HTH domain-containing protein [Halanaeroarchaeum sulfurireducens]ALG81965.1 bacterio-opsin activator HTH domain-containing protein [Halanaeroarchaeum sulfurireducens]
MLIAELTIEHPILGVVLQRVPGIELEWEETYERDDGRTQMLAWIESEDFDAVAEAIEVDSTVRNPDVLTQVDDRRLYRVEFSELGKETDLMPEFLEVGSGLESVVATEEGWTIRARYPNRAALSHIYKFCQNHDIPVSIDNVYDRQTWTEQGVTTLSEPQRQIMREAIECGYLSIPRECSLAELGERLDISESAASERFRRAARNLAEKTVI